MKLKRNGRGTAYMIQKYKINFIKDTQMQQEYRLTLRNKFHIIQDLQVEEDTI